MMWKHPFSPPAKKFQVMLPGRKNVVMSFSGGQDKGLGVKITIMACFLWISLTVVTLYLLSVIVVDFKGYGRPFITKDLG